MTTTPVAPADPRQQPRAAWRFMSTAEVVLHLKAHRTIPDSAWTSEKRLPGELRSDFIDRVLAR